MVSILYMHNVHRLMHVLADAMPASIDAGHMKMRSRCDPRASKDAFLADIADSVFLT